MLIMSEDKHETALVLDVASDPRDHFLLTFIQNVLENVKVARRFFD